MPNDNVRISSEWNRNQENLFFSQSPTQAKKLKLLIQFLCELVAFQLTSIQLPENSNDRELKSIIDGSYRKEATRTVRAELTMRKRVIETTIHEMHRRALQALVHCMASEFFETILKDCKNDWNCYFKDSHLICVTLATTTQMIPILMKI